MFVILYSIPCKSCELEETEWFRRSRYTNSFDTEAPLLGLDWSITNGIVSSKIYDKRDDFYLKSAIITIVHPLLREVNIVLHWTRPWAFSCFIGFAHSRLFFVVSMFCLSMLCRSPVQRLCNEVASLLTYSITHFFVVG